MMSTGPRRNSWRPELAGRHYAVSCGHYLGTAAAVRILERGGNAVDAGVAAALAMAAAQPEIVSFSGVAPTLIFRPDDRQVHSLAGLGGWPRAVDIDRLRRVGGGAVPDGVLRTVVPAAPATHVEALMRFGTISFEEAASSALDIARHGFAAYPAFVRHLHKFEAQYRRWPSSVELFFPAGRVPRVGEIFRQPGLAATIETLMAAERRAGGDRSAKLRAVHDCYYQGPIARAIAEFHRQEGGFLTADDLADFKVPVEASIACSYRGYTVHTGDVWCQGIVLLQALKTLECADVRSLVPGSVPYVHRLAEAMNLAFADREAYVGDPRFVDVPVAGLLSAGYADLQHRRIDPRRAFGTLPMPGRPPGLRRDPFIPDLGRFPAAGPGAATDTTYCAVVTADGSAYSATLSDNARDTPVVPALGCTVSSRGSQGRLEPEHPSVVQAGKRPRMTPAPALVLRDGAFAMAIGSPGGDVQTQAVLQVLLLVLEFGSSLQEAVERPRFGTFGFPGSFSPHPVGGLCLERGGFPPAIACGLQQLGHRIVDWPALAAAAGAVCAIDRDVETGWLRAAADPRREAYAMVR